MKQMLPYKNRILSMSYASWIKGMLVKASLKELLLAPVPVYGS
jgi:hypothetical protein